MLTEWEDNYIQLAKEHVRFIKQRTPVTEFRKGQVLFIHIPGYWGVAVQVLRVNKNTLSVHSIGMQGKNKITGTNYPTRADRLDKISISELLHRPPVEISRNEAAELLYANKLYRSVRNVK